MKKRSFHDLCGVSGGTVNVALEQLFVRKNGMSAVDEKDGTHLDLLVGALESQVVRGGKGS